MKVLVIGSGGREQALAMKIAESRQVEKIYLAPGATGIQVNDKIENIPIAANSYIRLVEFAKLQEVDLTIVGPDQALADGIVNLFEDEKLKIFGPTRGAAQLEASKEFAKQVMQQASIPTAAFQAFAEIDSVNAFLENNKDKNYVVKKDGLALGKGVVVCDSIAQAKTTAWQFLVEEKCGKIIIEEKLEGRELSFFAICDGNSFVTLTHACDYKRIRDNDEGPNTGGMGAYAPVDWIKPAQEKQIENNIIKPLLKTMNDRGLPFKGCLFIGIMMTSEGPKVLEFNVRFGDPETQAIMPLIDEDLTELLMDAVELRLGQRKAAVKLKAQQCVHLVMASFGYPGTEGVAVRKGDQIKIDCQMKDNHYLFFAGVKKQDDQLVTNGGRVLGLSTIADSREIARKDVYELAAKINFAGMQYRKDIARL